MYMHNIHALMYAFESSALVPAPTLAPTPYAPVVGCDHATQCRCHMHACDCITECIPDCTRCIACFSSPDSPVCMHPACAACLPVPSHVHDAHPTIDCRVQTSELRACGRVKQGCLGHDTKVLALVCIHSSSCSSWDALLMWVTKSTGALKVHCCMMHFAVGLALHV